MRQILEIIVSILHVVLSLSPEGLIFRKSTIRIRLAMKSKRFDENLQQNLEHQVRVKLHIKNLSYYCN